MIAALERGVLTSEESRKLQIVYGIAVNWGREKNGSYGPPTTLEFLVQMRRAGHRLEAKDLRALARMAKLALSDAE